MQTTGLGADMDNGFEKLQRVSSAAEEVQCTDK